MSEFNRGLSDKFVDQLAEEANKGSWWADVLHDPKLFVAVRCNYLDVYWRGQSLFLVKPGSSGLKVMTHPKYLVDPALKTPVSLTDNNFAVGSIERGLIRTYKGRETLDKMKTAAGLFSGLEKTGCHEIAVGKSPVIDCEIAFGDDADSKTAPSVDSADAHAKGGRSGAPRVDLATVEPEGDRGARLVFWEAKHFDNPELRARPDRPVPVWNQVKTYREYISGHRDQVVCSYKKVAANLVAINSMRREPDRRLSQLIVEVAAHKRQLTLSAEPKVGLVIFGFDKAEKDDPVWRRHLERLKSEVKAVVVEGDAKHIQL